MINESKEIFDTILKINPDARIITTGNTLDNIVIQWLEGTTPISKADIKTEMDKLQAIEDSN